jgi:hypothetical protein
MEHNKTLLLIAPPCLSNKTAFRHFGLFAGTPMEPAYLIEVSKVTIWELPTRFTILEGRTTKQVE